MNKKWVFGALVSDDKDAIGLIAYALYKHKKHTLATALRREGKTEDYIQQQVQIFHDQTLQNDSLNDYREKATNFLDEIFSKLEQDIEDRYEKEKAQLKKDHVNAIKKEKQKLIKNIEEFKYANRAWYEKLGLWLLSGIPGIVSSFVVTTLIIGSAVLFVPEQKKQEIFEDLIKNYLGLPKNESNEPTVK